MNNGRKIFWALLAFAVALLVLLLLNKRQPVVTAALPKIAQTNTTEHTPQQNILPLKANIQSHENSQVKVEKVFPPDEVRRQAALAHNAPIDFWGKVIDQNDAPLSGVKVTANARTFIVLTNGQPYTAFPKTNLMTGPDGIFEIHGMKGDVLTVEAMEKEGYETDAGTLREFDYGSLQNFTPEPNNPILFRMWSKGMKQSSVISGDKVFNFTPDGRLYAFNFTNSLLTEAKEPTGDLLIEVKRPDNVQRGQNFDWSYKIKVQNGGILPDFETPYWVMTLAPTSGYDDSYENQFYANDPGWKNFETNRRFYIKWDDGQDYGRIEISVDAARAEMRIRYAVNLSGSPILR